MAHPPRLTRRISAQMSEMAHRRLRVFAQDAGLSENEALTFVFENLGGLMDEAALMHRLRAFKEKHALHGAGAESGRGGSSN